MVSDHDNITNSIAYLNSLNKECHNLVAIHPLSNDIKGITTSSSHTLSSFISAHVADYNIYYSVNEPSLNAPNNKLKKEHIAYLHGVWLDADPIKGADLKLERERLLRFADTLKNQPTPPSFIIDSGSGVQAFWYLKDRIPANSTNVNQFESLGRGLSFMHNTDAVQNVDRIMRLPFTYNIPNEHKQKAGRIRTTATILHDSNRRYALDELLTLAELIDAPEYVDIETYDFNFSDLKDTPSKQLAEKWNLLRKSDEKIKGILSAHFPSRSEYDMALISRLKDLEWDLQDIAQIAYVSPKGKNKDLTKREIIRAYSRAKGTVNIMALDQSTVDAISQQKNPLIHEVIKPKRKYVAAGLLTWRSNTTPLLKGLIDQATLVSIYGQSNVGKSFVATDISAHIAMGRDWAGYKCKAKASVLYVAAEAAATYGMRADAVKLRMGIPFDADITQFPFGVYQDNISLFQTDKTTGICPGLEQLVAEANFLAEDSGLPCKLIVIDTLASVFGGGNENSFDDMGLLIDNLLKLIRRTGATVLIVHHSGKDQTKGERGHSSLIAALDTSLEVKLTNIGAKDRRELIARKQRSNDSNVKVEFNLNVVKLGEDDDGDPVTSCNIILPTDTAFMSIIPDKMVGLTPGQVVAYKTIAISQYTLNYDKPQMYGWYNFIYENPEYTIEMLQNKAKQGSSPPVRQASDLLVSNDTVSKQWRTLGELGLIFKNKLNQYVINEGELGELEAN